MLVMWTTEYPADPIRELVCSQQTVGFYDLALAVYPLGLDGVQPRTLLGQKAAYDPHSAAAVLDAAIVLAEPAPDLLGDVPGGVVPDQKQDLLSTRFELLQAPPEKLRRYRTHRPAVDESQPRLIDLWKVESVAGDGLRLGIVFGERPLDEAKGLALLGPTVQRGQCQSAPPALVTEANRPRFGVGLRHAHQPVAPPFFLSYKGSGEVIHRLARIHLTPRRRAKVARMVSPETRLSVSPSSKAASAAISKVQRLVPYPNSLGERWSISLKVSALCSSKAARVRFGREEPALRAPRPLSSKSWMAFLTVWEPHPKLRAILGGDSPRELARRIWLRRRTKASLERSPASKALRSSWDNARTKIGGFMTTTIAHPTQSILTMH